MRNSKCMPKGLIDHRRHQNAVFQHRYESKRFLMWFFLVLSTAVQFKSAHWNSHTQKPLSWTFSVNASFFLSILNVSHCYVLVHPVKTLVKKYVLIGLDTKKPITLQMWTEYTENAITFHKQVKCMLWLLCYASVAAWHCFNVSVYIFLLVLPLF